MSTLKKHLILSLLAVSTYGYSQDSNPNSIEVNGDPRIEKLIKTYDSIKKKNNKVAVYRVQVFSGTRENANAALKHFEKNYYSYYSNIIYDQPNFKVKVGSFRNRNEANTFVKSILKNYKSSFVLKETIAYSEFIKDRSSQPSTEEGTEDNIDY